MGTQTEVCEGLVDLIRDLDAPPEEQVVGPCMAREELARGLLVVVVIGPASTKIHQVGQTSTRPCLVVSAANSARAWEIHFVLAPSHQLTVRKSYL